MAGGGTIRAYIFDFDDTLVRTRQCRFAAIKALAERHYSHQLSDADINLHWGKPFSFLFESLFNSVDGDTGRVIERYLALVDEFPIDAHVGAVEALTALSESYFVGVVTSSHSCVVVADLRRLNFPVSKIAHIQCAEDTAVHKPNPRVFDPLLAILGQRGIARGESLYVGDAVTDLSAAAGADIPFVGYRGDPSGENPFTAHPVRVVFDLRELVPQA